MRIDEEARYRFELRVREDPLMQLIDAKIAALMALREAYMHAYALGICLNVAPDNAESEQAAEVAVSEAGSTRTDDEPVS